MIAALIRQDPAMRTLRGSLLLALAGGLFLGALVSSMPGWFERGFQGVDKGWLVFGFSQIWLILLLFMIVSHITVRCARLSLVLPLTARVLWPARIISITMAGLLPLAVLIVTVSVSPLIFQGRPGPTAEVLRLGCLTGLGLILAVMLYQTPSTGLYSIRAGRMYILYAVIVSCGIPALILLNPGSLLLGLVMLAGCILLGLRIYRSLPQVLALAPREASRAGEPDRPAAVRIHELRADVSEERAPTERTAAGRADAVCAPPRTEGFSALLHSTVFRVLVNHPLTWIILPVAAFYGYSLVRAYYLGRDLQPHFLISLIWLVALLFQGIIRMYKLDHLPISRRPLLAYSVLPVALVTLAGVGAGQLHFMLKQSQFKMIRYYCEGVGCNRFTVRVPDDCWEIAWDGIVPPVTSPWGESHVPEAHHLYKGSSIALYNPYEVGEASSDDFVELQINKAIEDIHGVPAPTRRATHPSGDDANLRESPKRGEPAVVWPENRGSDMRNRTMAARVLLFGLITAGIISLGLQQFRATTPEHVYPWLLQGIAAPILLLLGGLYVADQLGFANFRAFAAFPEILIRKLGESLPLSTPAMWALALAVLAAGYLLIQYRFNKIEAPIQKKKRLSEY